MKFIDKNNFLSEMDPISKYIFLGRSIRANDAKTSRSGRARKTFANNIESIKQQTVKTYDPSTGVTSTRKKTAEEQKRALSQVGGGLLRNQGNLKQAQEIAKTSNTFNVKRMRGFAFPRQLDSGDLLDFATDRGGESSRINLGKKYGSLPTGYFVNEKGELRNVNPQSNASQEIFENVDAHDIASPFLMLYKEQKYPEFIHRAAEALGKDREVKHDSPRGIIPVSLAADVKHHIKINGFSDKSIADGLMYLIDSLDNETLFSRRAKFMNIERGYDFRAQRERLIAAYPFRYVDPLGGSAGLKTLKPRKPDDKESPDNLRELYFGYRKQKNNLQSNLLSFLNVNNNVFYEPNVHEMFEKTIDDALSASRSYRLSKHGHKKEMDISPSSGIAQPFKSEALKSIAPSRLVSAFKMADKLIGDQKGGITMLAEFALQGGGPNVHVGKYAHGDVQSAAKEFNALITNNDAREVIVESVEEMIQAVRDLDTIDKIIKDIGSNVDSRHRRWKTTSGKVFSELEFDQEKMANWYANSLLPFVQDTYNGINPPRPVVSWMINEFAPQLLEEGKRLINQDMTVKRWTPPKYWSQNNSAAERILDDDVEQVDMDDFLHQQWLEQDIVNEDLPWGKNRTALGEARLKNLIDIRKTDPNWKKYWGRRSLNSFLNRFKEDVLQGTLPEAIARLVRLRREYKDARSQGINSEQEYLYDLDDRDLDDLRNYNDDNDFLSDNDDPELFESPEPEDPKVAQLSKKNEVNKIRNIVNEFAAKEGQRMLLNGMTEVAGVGLPGRRITMPDQILHIDRIMKEKAMDDQYEVDPSDIIPWPTKAKERAESFIEENNPPENPAIQERRLRSQRAEEVRAHYDKERAKAKHKARMKSRAAMRADFESETQSMQKEEKFSSSSRENLDNVLNQWLNTPREVIDDMKSKGLGQMLRMLTTEIVEWDRIGDGEMVDKMEKVAKRILPSYIDLSDDGIKKFDPGPDSNRVEMLAYRSRRAELAKLRELLKGE